MMKLKRKKRDVRGLVERAILIARMPNTTDTPKDDLLAIYHLLETQAVSFKTAKIANFEVLHDISKRLTVLSSQLARH